jgi:predicted dehydrogenase
VSPVGVGVIGAGTISDTYLENLTAFPDLDVRMVADLNLDRAATQAALYGVPRSGTVSDLLADPDIEIVVNLTVPAAHVEVGLAALSAGKHVWAEKPLALDRAGGRELLDRAQANGLRLASAPDTVLGAGLQAARRALDAGTIGTPYSALALFQSPGPESWHPAPEFLFRAGAGPLFDMGPYYLTALVHLLGPVAQVKGHGRRPRATRTIGSGPRAGTSFEVTVETTVTALLEFAGGGSAYLVTSFDSAVSRTTIEVTGTTGTAALPDPNTFAGATLIHRAEGTSSVAADGHQATRGTGVLELARAIQAGEPERASGEIAFHVLDTMLAIAESAATRRSVTVSSTAVIPPPLPADWDPYSATVSRLSR